MENKHARICICNNVLAVVFGSEPDGLKIL